MQKVSYMGDGSTTDFYFSFPFYTNTDVIVLKNNQITTDYTIVGTQAGLNADIPYIGGTIIFDSAPSATESITIYRHLPLSRTVDYQPTEKINPTILNQDMNYMMEILKDMQDKMDVFSEQYNDIVNKESTDNLLSKINYINQLIDNNNYIANCAMPSTRYIDLTLPASGGTVIMPADGYLTVNKAASADGQLITMINNSNGANVGMFSTENLLNLRLLMPVSKSDVVTINYTTAGLTNMFRLIYANGAQ